MQKRAFWVCNMIYNNWMSFIKDDVKITSLVIPGAHNAGSYGMKKLACCQDGRLDEQFMHGIRQYCLRLDTAKNGSIMLAHGLTQGDRLENALRDLCTVLSENPTEIILLDLREYYPQKFGPITVKYHADPAAVDALLRQYLEPEKYALCDFDHVRDVTLGDFRKQGKRYILINDAEAYRFSKNCEQILPWEKKVNGSFAKDFAAQTLEFFDRYHTNGLYWFQTQQTPNFGTAVGITNPRALDKEMRMYFKGLIDGIAKTPCYLAQANIIAGDFMTEDYSKAEEILRLNLLKGNVCEGKEKEFEEGLKWN